MYPRSFSVPELPTYRGRRWTAAIVLTQACLPEATRLGIRNTIISFAAFYLHSWHLGVNKLSSVVEG
jgi:hypothetical protein